VERFTIGIDAGSGGTNLKEIAKGAFLAAYDLPDATLVLIGVRSLLFRYLAEISKNLNKPIPNNITIWIGEGIPVEMEDDPVLALASKKDSSMVKAFFWLKEGALDALITPGSTSVAGYGGYRRIGPINRGIRPGIITPFPTVNGRYSYVMDSGALADCRSQELVGFSAMATSYLRSSLDYTNPSVGILSIGEEKKKGNKLIEEVWLQIDSNSGFGLNFIDGNIEGRDIPLGTTDIIVCDGYTGNIVLKLSESLAKSVLEMVINSMTRTTKGKIGAALVKTNLKEDLRVLDYEEYGGAIMLGIKKPLIICHGNSGWKAIYNATVKTTFSALSNRVIEAMKSDLLQIDWKELAGKK